MPRERDFDFLARDLRAVLDLREVARPLAISVVCQVIRNYYLAKFSFRLLSGKFQNMTSFLFLSRFSN